MYLSNPGHPGNACALIYLVEFFNIKVQALCPGFTKTSFYETESYKDFDEDIIPKWLCMTPERVVEDSLAALRKDEVVVVPGKRNKILLFFLRNSLTLSILKLYYGKRIKRKMSIELL